MELYFLISTSLHLFSPLNSGTKTSSRSLIWMTNHNWYKWNWFLGLLNPTKRLKMKDKDSCIWLFQHIQSNKKKQKSYFSISAKLIASSIPGIAFASSENKLSIPSLEPISSFSTLGSTSYRGSRADWNYSIFMQTFKTSIP